MQTDWLTNCWFIYHAITYLLYAPTTIITSKISFLLSSHYRHCAVSAIWLPKGFALSTEGARRTSQHGYHHWGFPLVDVAWPELLATIPIRRLYIPSIQCMDVVQVDNVSTGSTVACKYMPETRLLLAASVAYVSLLSECLSRTFNLLLLYVCCLLGWLAACVIYWVGTWVTVGSSSLPGDLPCCRHIYTCGAIQSVCTCLIHVRVYVCYLIACWA